MVTSTNFLYLDVHELIAMLKDIDPSVMNIRPSKISSIFASRACRKSIMIGTTLTEATMKRVVSNLSQLDQPWNCPHGRPTIRHLTDLDSLALSENEDRNFDFLTKHIRK